MFYNVLQSVPFVWAQMKNVFIAKVRFNTKQMFYKVCLLWGHTWIRKFHTKVHFKSKTNVLQSAFLRAQMKNVFHTKQMFFKLCLMWALKWEKFASEKFKEHKPTLFAFHQTC